MINILAGLVNKSEGSAKICGFDIKTDTRAARASIGIVPQEIAMDVFFTPFQALELQAGYSRRIISKRPKPSATGLRLFTRGKSLPMSRNPPSYGANLCGR